mgnify:FL=1
MNKPLNKPGRLIAPTDAEDAAINRGIAADPDTIELTAGMVAKMKPLARRGRPAVDDPKKPLTTRLDADVLAAIKATGKGWQTRLNEVLREDVAQGMFKVKAA